MKKITFCILLLVAVSSWSQSQTVALDPSPCGGSLAAFYQDFDNAVIPALPACWTSILRGETLDSEAFIKSAQQSSVHTAPNAVEFYNAYSNAVPDPGNADMVPDDIILVSPKVASLSFNTNRLRFFAQGAGSLQIGILSSNSSDAEFTLVAEIPTTAIATQYIVQFANYTGGNAYIGIRMNNANFNTSIFVDGINWEVIPACPDVTAITVPSLTPDGGIVTWNEGGSETSWELAVASTTVNDPDTATVITSEDSTKVLSGLNPATQYKVWVRSVCSTDSKGVWIGPVIFTTACNATAYVNEGFDNVVSPEIPTCWTKLIKGPTVGNASILTQPFNYHSAPQSVGMYSDVPTVEGDDIVLVSPNLTTVAGGYRLKFFAQGGASLQVGTLTSNTDSAIFTSVLDITTDNENKEYTVEFGGYTGTDHYVGIRMNNDATYYEQVFVDNIVWEAIPSCLDVTDLYVAGVTSTTANIGWAAADSESSWDVVYSDGSVNPDTLTPVSTPSASISLEGLASSTFYNVWIRSVCSDTNRGAWIGPATFKTDCGAVADFTENFDGVEGSELPTCWKSIVRGYSTGFPSVKTSTESVSSSPNCVKLSNSNSNGADVILVSPNVLSSSFNTHQLEFYARKNSINSDVQLELGTLDNTTADAVFSSVQTISLTSTTAKYVIDYTSYAGLDQYIGFRLVNNSGSDTVFIDDIQWRTVPLCPDVSEITVPLVGVTTAGINWNEEGSSVFQLGYTLSSVTDTEAMIAIIDANEGTASLTGLTAATGYNVWVRSVCTAGNGAWIGPITFSTLCDAVDVPYVQDFETALAPELPECTTAINVGQGNIWEVVEFPSNGFLSNTLKYTYNPDNAADTWFYTRGVNLIANETYIISYKFGTGSYSESLKVAYGTSPDVNGMTDVITNYTGIIQEDPLNESFGFTVPTTGVYYFGFNAYSEAFMDAIYIDDIKINPSLGIGGNELSQLKFYPNPVKNQLNLSYANATITYVSIYNLLGQEVLTDLINANNAIVDVSTLARGTYMVKVNAGNQVKVIKMIKE